jgi:hypothetical protein
MRPRASSSPRPAQAPPSTSLDRRGYPDRWTRKNSSAARINPLGDALVRLGSFGPATLDVHRRLRAAVAINSTLVLLLIGAGAAAIVPNLRTRTDVCSC